MAQETDIVLIHFEDNPVVFARIEAISPDAKPDWYHVKLLLLQIPPQPVTWILRNEYINGGEFTMDGKRMRLELVESPVADEDANEPESPAPEETGEKSDPETGGAKVISLSRRKKE